MPGIGWAMVERELRRPGKNFLAADHSPSLQ
jgi:hypothetical protein